MVPKPITRLKRADLSIIQYIKEAHFRERQVDSNKGLIQSKQWRSQDFSVRESGGGPGEEPPAAGSHWGPGNKAQPPEDGGLRQSPQPRRQGELEAKSPAAGRFLQFFNKNNAFL